MNIHIDHLWTITLILSIIVVMVECHPQHDSKYQYSNLGIQELSHDYTLKKLEPEKVQKLKALLDTSISFQYHQEHIPNTVVKYYLSKPWRLRYAELYQMSRDVHIVHRESKIIFDRIKLIHEGLYSLYQFYFEKLPNIDDKEYGDYEYNNNYISNVNHYQQIPIDNTNLFSYAQQQNIHMIHDPDPPRRLVRFTRRDFNLVINGLKKEREFCRDDNECESGSCPSLYCVCNRQEPIYNETTRHCLEARNYNETCLNDAQCEHNGGILSECYQDQYISRCQCQRNSVPIKISSTQRHCVQLAEYNTPCLFAKQCALNGENRYCNGNYRCDCLPGFHLLNEHLQHGRRCVVISGAITIHHSSTTLVTCFILIILLLFCCCYHHYSL